MIVTTAGRTNQEYIERAKQTAADLGIPYVKRNKQSIAKMFSLDANVVVVGKQGIELHNKETAEPYFFHPNVAMIRAKRLMKGEHDPFVEMSGLQAGDSFLDCTLGYGSDSIIASLVVGDQGKVIGIESSTILAYIVKEGLQSWESQNTAINAAMRRVEVRNGHHLELLKSMQDHSVDVVYFDPMFEESIAESNALQAMAYHCNHETITMETIEEARRVARKKIVLKDHFRSERFQLLGFEQQIRKTAKFHFGVIDV
ncbi:MAG: class I SAM-dependent methyltransferase [Bacillus sp. (in: firmicutes)]